MLNFGPVIRFLRIEKGMSQGELADLIGVARSSVSWWECGRTGPSMASQELLAGAFGITGSELAQLANQSTPSLTVKDMDAATLKWFNCFEVNAARFPTGSTHSAIAATPLEAARQAGIRFHFGDSDPASPTRMTFVRVVEDDGDRSWNYQVHAQTIAVAREIPIHKDDQ